MKTLAAILLIILCSPMARADQKTVEFCLEYIKEELKIKPQYKAIPMPIFQNISTIPLRSLEHWRYVK